MARVSCTLRTAAIPVLVWLAATLLGAVALGSYLAPLICWLACSACVVTGVLWMAWEAAGHRQ